MFSKIGSREVESDEGATDGHEDGRMHGCTDGRTGARTRTEKRRVVGGWVARRKGGRMTVSERSSAVERVHYGGKGRRREGEQGRNKEEGEAERGNKDRGEERGEQPIRQFIDDVMIIYNAIKPQRCESRRVKVISHFLLGGVKNTAWKNESRGSLRPVGSPRRAEETPAPFVR